jgi:hypothetical protein
MKSLFDFSDEKPPEVIEEVKLPDIFIDTNNSKLIEEAIESLSIGEWKYNLPILIGTKREKNTEYVATVPLDKTIKGFTLRKPEFNDPVTVYCERGIKFFNGKTEYDTNYLEGLLYTKYSFVKFKYGILFAFED